MECVDKEEDYGLIRPSLIRQLRAILDQYPDDGHILKELIQNAEDAGAKHIVFLHDEHTHPTDKLHHPGMVAYQGAALYAFNDAVFREKDWLGIRMLQDSVKEKDPMKVGRFGLGFKSVLHMTDLPSVISGDRLYVIDPHETFFQYQGEKTSGYSWNLREKQKELRKVTDQVEPYLGLFGCTQEIVNSGHYQGTLFRFPLRKSPSRLSSVIYTKEKMEELFRSFQSDAHNNLLFLKNLESIELQVRKYDEAKPKVIFRVELSPSSVHKVRQNRMSFMQKLSQSMVNQDITTTYLLTVTTSNMPENQEASTHTDTYIVNEYRLGLDKASGDLQKLQADSSLSLVPLVGVAMPVKTEKDKTGEDRNEEFTPRGQAFCFLPMPVEQKSATGLPVHINGFFAVSQDRRHLKWPTAGQNVHSDKSLLWNHCLLMEAVPLSYTELVRKAVEMSTKNPKLIRPSFVYEMIPDIVQVDERWQVLLKPLFSRLFAMSVLYTSHGGGTWLKIKDCFFDCLKEDEATRKVVVETLLAEDVRVTCVPGHVLHAIGAFTSQCPEVITPALCRSAMRHKAFTGTSASDKILLLEYVLKDEDFVDLAGVYLLPTGDGEFKEFSSQKPAVCLPTDDCPRELLPGYENHLVSGELPDEVLAKLTKLAKEGCLQIELLNKDAVRHLLPKVIPKSWKGKHLVLWDPTEEVQIPENWLSQVWLFLRKFYPSTLKSFSGLPLLPLCTTYPMKLIPLSLDTTAMFKNSMGMNLPEGVAKVLEKMGVYVVEDLPEYVINHAAVVGNYVSIPFPDDVLQVMHNVYQRDGTSGQYLDAIRNEIPPEDKDQMLEFLSKLQLKELSSEYKAFLGKLPLFKSTASTSEEPDYVSACEVKKAGPVHKLPVSIDTKYIDVSSEHAKKIATLCGVTYVPLGKLLKETVLTEFRQGKVNNDRAEKTATHIFTNFNKYTQHDSDFVKVLADIPFVVTEEGRVEKPCNLYDPDVPELTQLVADQDAFPGGIYRDPSNLMILRKVGLKSVHSVSPLDILHSIIHVEEVSKSEDDLPRAVQKATAILKFLQLRPHFLYEDVNGQLLVEWASGLKWIPTFQEKPSLIPSSLPLFDSPALVMPSEATSAEWLPVVSSVQAVIKFGVSSDVAQAFGWSIPPPTSLLFKQLENVDRWYVADEKARYIALVGSLYDNLAKKDVKEVGDSFSNDLAWLWHGDGFTDISHMVAKKPGIDMSPYLYCLPPEMVSFQPFFLKCGMREKISGQCLVAVLQEMADKHSKDGGSDVQRDLQLSIDVLNLLCHYDLSDEDRSQLLVPVQVEDSSLSMLPVHEATYCDVEWVRKGYDLMAFDKQDGVIFIHPNLPTSTAERLHVPTLMSRMLHAEELDITGFGQAEPLTDRLRKLLEEYTDGLAIPKELVQNADDAGATEFKILYDQRTNKDSMKFLIDENMQECQGPALWAFNNATFSDKDFENITKLGGATKAEEEDKIGKFGLGFNAVYNVTDVPSFISGNNLVIFDPHTTHLGRGIKDKSKPGIKINLSKNRTLLRKLPHQFSPYNDVFNCTVSAEQDQSFYNGTLFRLPLRTKKQAKSSEISPVYYDKYQVEELLQMLLRSAQNMLLFTQNVEKISVFHLSDGERPQHAELVFETSRSILNVFRPLSSHSEKDSSDNQLRKSTRFLEAAADFMRKRDTGDPLMVTPSSSIVMMVSTIFTETEELELKPPADADSFWLVSSCMGLGSSMTIANKSSHHLLPIGGAAVRLQSHDGGTFVPIELKKISKSGRAFYYLPLPVKTGLPVHINAPFAVHSNRRQLYEVTEDDKQLDKLYWNMALLEDSVVRAYVQLLHDLKAVLPKEAAVPIYDLWPSSKSCSAYFQPLVKAFFDAVVTSFDIPMFQTSKQTITFGNASFLHPSFVADKEIENLVMTAFEQCYPEQAVMVLPNEVMDSFISTGFVKMIKEKMYDKNRFFRDVFFPNLALLGSDIRDPLVFFALQQTDQEMCRILVDTPCIPVSPDGSILQRPPDIVHPSSPAAKIFMPEDGKFPHGSLFLSAPALQALQRLGMKTNDVTWDDIISSASNIAALATRDTEQAHQIVYWLYSFIDKKLISHERNIKAIHSDYEHQQNVLNEYQNKLAGLPFVSVRPKPTNFPVHWLVDETLGQFRCPRDLYPEKLMYLVSATQPIASEEGMSSRVKSFLKLTQRRASLEEVLTEMEHAISIEPSSLKEKEFNEYQLVMNEIYIFLQEKFTEENDVAENLADILKNKRCILVDDQLLRADQVAFSFSYDGVDNMVGLPREYRRKYQKLFECIGVRKQFEIGRYVEVLAKMKSDTGEKPLKESSLQTAVRMVSDVHERMQTDGVTIEDITKQHGDVFLPNTKGVLQPSSTLCYNDCPWIKDSPSMNFTHPRISFSTSNYLGVRTKRQEALSKHAVGIPFGQKEKLTSSLKRVLNSYPCDHGILLELIQNADDAKATEIHFVLDPRHHPTKLLFGDSWKPLQGPALCVYNNRPFTSADIEGIQKLGEGSKSDDASKVGQYGIGFSSVYHLTDAPSILTEGTNEALCVFDPMCAYVPGATSAEPGIRYEDVATLRGAFPDVFGCYLEKLFDLNNATMLRFPLRDRKMAERSEISKNQISLPTIRAILDELKEEAFNVLLFTNHLESVSVSEISHDTGELTNTHTYRALISQKDKEKRIEMNERAHDLAHKLRTNEALIGEAVLFDIDYQLYMTDNQGRQEKWCIAQRIGFEKGTIVPLEIERAFESSYLCLSPRAGVACLLEKRLHNAPIDSKVKLGKAFCFMPLPVNTKLPVQVNGHFALDHENRRHVWPSTKGSDFKRSWNEFLCRQVIAPAYLHLLKAIRMKALPVNELKDEAAVVVCPRAMLDSCIRAHQNFFPEIDEEGEWNVLVEAVYRLMVETNAPILPSVKDLGQYKHHSDGVISSTLEILWLPPCGEGLSKAFFSKPEDPEPVAQQQTSLFGKMKSLFRSSPRSIEKSDSQILKEVLLECGFKVLEASNSIVKNLEWVSAPLDYMSPAGVVVFFRSYSTDSPVCSIGQLPVHLTDSPFRDEKTLKVVLQYCCKDSAFSENLDGLPLLLTQDNKLRVFSADEPAYYSDFLDLLPESSHLFIKNTMAQELFNWCNKEECNVLRPLDIHGFAEILNKSIPANKFCSPNEHIQWDLDVLRETWIRKFWAFVGEKIEKGLDLSVTNKPLLRKLAKDSIEPLHEWNLLPARSGGRRLLYKLSMGKNVILFSRSDYKHMNLRRGLEKLRLPELDVGSLRLTGITEALSLLVTTLDNCLDVLSLLSQASVDNPAALNSLDNAEYVGILQYFSDNISDLQEDMGNESTSADTTAEDEEQEMDKESPKTMTSPDRLLQLRSLPFYTTIYGDTISLENCHVYTLPAKIPTRGVDVWQSKAGTVFLERKDSLQPLYDFLGCASISVSEVYCKFIFQHFEYFSQEDRLHHLHHVYSTYLKNPQQSSLSEDERELMIDTLKEVPIIEDANGDLLPVNEFYDPENTLFRVLLPEDKFPPRAPMYFKESDWHALLCKLGLIKEVSRDQFMEFTKQVSLEGRDCTSASALARSKMLVQHLYSMPPHLRDDILPDVAGVPFISPHSASPDLCEIYPQHGDLGQNKLAYVKFRESVSKKYENLVWTQASLLPDWADPSLQHGLSSGDQSQIQNLLQLKEPDVEVVLSHMKNLIYFISDNEVSASKASSLRTIFKDLYRFFQSSISDKKEIIARLKESSCILVKDGTKVIQPEQAVLNMFESDEIQPHLYRVPLEFGEFQAFFKLIGVAERVTVNHYALVLQNLKEVAGPTQLIPSEMTVCLKALKGFFETLEVSSSRDITLDYLYLPSEAGILVDATRLVFNDAPSFYDRAQKCGLQFLFNLKECGYRSKHAEEILHILPPRVCPGMLSIYVKEHLVDRVKSDASITGVAEFLSKRVKCEEFLRGVARLIRHEAHRRDQRLDEESMFHMLDRLSTINIFCVESVATYLTFRDKTILGSEADKACFVETVRNVESRWNVYIKRDAVIGEDLLIPLADVINSILGGMLHNSVLYLLPILSCPDSQIQDKLNNLNIRLDQSREVEKNSVLPRAGEPVHHGQEQYLQEADEFIAGECVAYITQNDKVYATIEEEVLSPDDERVYLIVLGKSTVIAHSSKLRKFVRAK